VFNVTAHRQNASVGYTQSEHLAALFVTQKYHAKLFYRVKPFARIIRKNVTPLQNWKPFSSPKNVYQLPFRSMQWVTDMPICG
jgi:hypothetical protein|tara:strand:+ start:765 stop:1013 length:249 start_codon:yes stop_codon:yes gene_type:complete